MYALIKNGFVENIIDADAAFAESIEAQWDHVVPVVVGDAGIGWAYANGDFAAPPAPPAPPAPVAQQRVLSKLGFRNRFTSAEKAAIEFAAIDDPAASLPARMGAAAVRATLADQRDAEFIDPTRPDTRQGAMAMESYGLLDAGRALEILDAPILAHEQYTRSLG